MSGSLHENLAEDQIEHWSNEWEIVIGLETHAQIISKSKLFSGASTGHAEMPNYNACGFDLAMPGMLPVLNVYCVEQAVKTGLALGSKIHHISVFDRKHYFYPDLPSGYQISQFYKPIVTGGAIHIILDDGTEKNVRICRAHLEQDAGKSVHDIIPGYSCIDFNRAGVALLEIVTEPDISSAREAVEYVKNLQSILRYAEVCTGDMENGALRCDANISVRRKGDAKLGTRCEIKNLNSLTSLTRAIEYEASIQVAALKNGEKILQCTKLFDVESGVTRLLRLKENSDDYAYFNDPDLLPVVIDDAFIDKVKKAMPELPDAKRVRYCENYGLSKYDADVLIADKAVAAYFDSAVEALNDPSAVKTLANWITTQLFGRMNKMGVGIEKAPIDAIRMSALVKMLVSGVVSSKIGQQIFELMIDNVLTPEQIVEKHDLKQIDDVSSIEAVVDEVLTANPDNVAAYRSGKDKLMAYFVGQVMQRTKGKANPETVNKILRSKLSSK